MGRKLTQEEFIKQFNAEYGENYTLISDYVNTTTNISIKHNKCGFVFPIKPYDMKKLKQCACCANKIIVQGINDMWTTHPHIAKFLKNPNDGNIYCYGTHSKLCFMCPNCKKEYIKRPSEAFDKNGKLICSNCGDGFSYPEKFISNLLTQLGVSYIYQLNKSHFVWIGSYRYDFYLPKYNCIIEVHGTQHYTDCDNWRQSLEDIQQNDLDKFNLAKENNIDKYIVINAKYSNSDFLKSNILSSELNSLFDLSLIDWESCDKKAMNSLYIQSYSEWNNGNKDLNNIAAICGISLITTYRYLEKANKNKLCDFNRKEYAKKISDIGREKSAQKNRKKIRNKDQDVIYSSVTEASEKTGISRAYLKTCCENPKYTAKGDHWEFVN